MKVKKILSLLLIGLVSVTSVGCGEKDEAQTKDGKIVIWTFSKDQKEFAEKYMEKNPDVEVEVTLIPLADYPTKLTAALSRKAKIPDVIMGESQMLSNFFKAEFFEDLTKAPYNVADYKDDILDYVYKAGQDKDGVVRALSYQVTLGGMTYRRDIAKTIWENYDPTWENLILRDNSKDTKDKFGITTGPNSYFAGGIFMGISSFSENKKIAWDFVKFSTLNEETSEWWVEKLKGDVVSLKSVLEDNKEFENQALGGQKSYEFLLKETEKIDYSLVTKYDDEIGKLHGQVIEAVQKVEKTKDEALKEFYGNVISIYPEIKVQN